MCTYTVLVKLITGDYSFWCFHWWRLKYYTGYNHLVCEVITASMRTYFQSGPLAFCGWIHLFR